MKCLFTYKWVKLPRAHIPTGKGLMGSFLRLASRAAFRPGKARYCGYTNDVNAGSWVGGIVGLKSILGVKGSQAGAQRHGAACGDGLHHLLAQHTNEEAHLYHQRLDHGM